MKSKLKFPSHFLPLCCRPKNPRFNNLAGVFIIHGQDFDFGLIQHKSKKKNMKTTYYDH